MKEISVNVSVKCNFVVPVIAQNVNSAKVIARSMVDEILAKSGIESLYTWEEYGYRVLESREAVEGVDYNKEDVIPVFVQDDDDEDDE